VFVENFNLYFSSDRWQKSRYYVHIVNFLDKASSYTWTTNNHSLYKLSGWVIIIDGDVGVDAGSLQENSQPKLFDFMWGLAAAWRCSAFIRWTGWTLAMALPWRQNPPSDCQCLWFSIITELVCFINPCIIIMLLLLLLRENGEGRDL